MMPDMETVTAFFGWCTVINTGFLCFTAIMVLIARDWAKNIHSRLYKVDKEDLDRLYFDYLARFKILVITLNLTPWIALKILT